MQFLKILFLLIVLVAVIEAQKGGTKSRQRPANIPPAPAPRKTQQPTKSPRPAPQPQRPQEDEGNAGNAIEENNEGESGPEPPAVVPQTSFTCDDKPYSPGMYADMEVDCSVYHMCFDNRKESFLCGTGTMFNQEILSCDHPGKVNCANSPQFYEANTELGKPGKPEPSGDSGSKGVAQPPPRQIPQQPRIQNPSKTSPQRPRPQPQPQPQPKPKVSQPFVDDEPDDESEAPAPAIQPVPTPKQRPSKTSPPKPRPQAVPQPKKQPAPRKPIVQSYDDNEGESNVRRAYRARY